MPDNGLSNMLTRRELIYALGLLGFSAAFSRSFANSTTLPLIQKPTPASGESIPVIGLGTSRTFNKASSQENLNEFCN